MSGDEVQARHLKVWQEWSAFASELRGDSDRAAVVVAGAKIESRLKDVLKSRLRPPRNKRGQGFVSFDSAVELAYRIGVLDEAAYDLLMAVKKLRNHFAHADGPVSLEENAHLVQPISSALPNAIAEGRARDSSLVGARGDAIICLTHIAVTLNFFVNAPKLLEAFGTPLDAANVPFDVVLFAANDRAS